MHNVFRFNGMTFLHKFCWSSLDHIQRAIWCSSNVQMQWAPVLLFIPKLSQKNKINYNETLQNQIISLSMLQTWPHDTCEHQGIFQVQIHRYKILKIIKHGKLVETFSIQIPAATVNSTPNRNNSLCYVARYMQTIYADKIQH